MAGSVCDKQNSECDHPTNFVGQFTTNFLYKSAILLETGS